MRYERYVAIGDSSTEGLEDPYPDGGYRGWADRLAEHIANGQSAPLHYANLAVRGLRTGEIRQTQFHAALALEPDLMTIFGGVNDCLGRVCDLDAVRVDLSAMFAQARAGGITVLTFTMPDPAAINPLGRRLRPRMFALNDIIRTEAERTGVIVMDFQRYPVTEDPRLWYDDRLHGSPRGHERVAAALAWRLGIHGADSSWSEPLPEEIDGRRLGQRLGGDAAWLVRHLTPWVVKNIRGIPHSLGITAKRPALIVVPVTAQAQSERAGARLDG